MICIVGVFMVVMCLSNSGLLFGGFLGLVFVVGVLFFYVDIILFVMVVLGVLFVL